MLILIAALDTAIADRVGEILFKLLHQRSKKLYSLAEEGRYEDLCDEGRKGNIPEAVIIGCYTYAIILYDNLMFNDAINMYNIVISSVRKIRVRESEANSKKGNLNKIKVRNAMKILEADVYHAMGKVYFEKRDYCRAIEYYIRAEKVYTEVIGSSHLYLAITYKDLGEIWMHKGDYDNAVNYFKKSLKIFLKVFDPEHPYVATVYNNLARAYEKKGNKKKAEEYRKKAEEYRKKAEEIRKRLGGN